MQVAHNLVKELIKYLRKNDNKLTTLQRISVVMVRHYSTSLVRRLLIILLFTSYLLISSSYLINPLCLMI